MKKSSKPKQEKKVKKDEKMTDEEYLLKKAKV